MAYYVQFNENNRCVGQSSTPVDGWEEITASLWGKDLLKETDGTIRELTDEEKASEVATAVSDYNNQKARGRRNILLAESDWVVTKASEGGVSVPTAWVTYRQALRDLPDHENWPLLEDADWPTAP